MGSCQKGHKTGWGGGRQWGDFKVELVLGKATFVAQSCLSSGARFKTEEGRGGKGVRGPREPAST